LKDRLTYVAQLKLDAVQISKQSSLCGELAMVDNGRPYHNLVSEDKGYQIYVKH